MPFDLGHPLAQSALLPLVVAAAAVGGLRLVGGPDRGRLLAGAGVALGFLAAYLAIFGPPAWPPRGAGQKLACVVAAGLLAGFALDLWRLPERLRAALAVLSALAASAWIAESRWAAVSAAPATWAPALAALAALGFAAAVVAGRGQTLTAPLMLLFAAAGLGILATVGAAASVGQAAGALAAAVAGFVLWNWPVARFPVQAGLLLPALAGLAALFTQALLFTRTDAAALAPLALLAGLGPLARRLPAAGAAGRALAPVWLALAGAVIVAAAVGIAVWRGATLPPI
jgi:hypothetical protein